jgi:hypothetical protein
MTSFMMAEPEEGLYGFTLHQSHTQKSNPTNKQPSLKKRQPLGLRFYGAERHQIETQKGTSEEINKRAFHVISIAQAQKQGIAQPLYMP